MANEPDKNKYPYNEAARAWSPSVVWMDVPVTTWRKMNAARLRTIPEKFAKEICHPRLKPLFDQIPQDGKDMLNARMAGGEYVEAKTIKSDDRANRKAELEHEAQRVLAEAAADQNHPAQIQAIKLMAELHALLNEKKQQDPVVNIYVNTGVER